MFQLFKILCNIVAMGLFGVACVSDRIGLEEKFETGVINKVKEYQVVHRIDPDNIDGWATTNSGRREIDTSSNIDPTILEQTLSEPKQQDPQQTQEIKTQTSPQAQPKPLPQAQVQKKSVKKKTPVFLPSINKKPQKVTTPKKSSPPEIVYKDADGRVITKAQFEAIKRRNAEIRKHNAEIAKQQALEDAKHNERDNIAKMVQEARASTDVDERDRMYKILRKKIGDVVEAAEKSGDKRAIQGAYQWSGHQLKLIRQLRKR